MGAIPMNVIGYYEKDLSSARMSPLLTAALETTDNEISKYIIVANFIRQRPKGWLDVVRKYVLTLEKNSFYLLTAFRDLKREYMYGFCSAAQKKDIVELLGVAIAKHELGSKRPKSRLAKKIGEKVIDSFKPKGDK